MSAASHNACPSCYQRVTGVPISEITQIDHLNKADEVDVDEESLSEYFETYLDKGCVVFEYHGAKCDDCGFTIPEFRLEHSFL